MMTMMEENDKYALIEKSKVGCPSSLSLTHTFLSISHTLTSNLSSTPLPPYPLPLPTRALPRPSERNTCPTGTN